MKLVLEAAKMGDTFWPGVLLARLILTAKLAVAEIWTSCAL